MTTSLPKTVGPDEAEPTGSLLRIWQSESDKVREIVYCPSEPVADHLDLDIAFMRLTEATHRPPPGLVPLTAVDDRSMACVICESPYGPPPGIVGSVVRWHLDDIPARHQGALLDTDPELYLTSVLRETEVLELGKTKMAEKAERYEAEYVNKQRVAKPEALRPFRLASQNVIVGLAAMRHDDAYDSHRVECWQACEAPHVATFEGCRALTVLTLCDAFQAGGTMELDFRQHPEKQVPALLQRFGRTLGLQLGSEIRDQKGISPTEARELFLAVTPMPAELRRRVEAVADQGEVTIEALCFSLMKPIWRPVELDFILGCSTRAGSMLTGGAPLDDPGRAAEFEMGRAARMLGMLYDRLNVKDTAGTSGSDGSAARAFDDRRYGITWSVVPKYGALHLQGLPAGELPWQRASRSQTACDAGADIVVVPRANPLSQDLQAVTELREQFPSAATVALVVPAGTWLPAGEGLSVLTCPDPLRSLDAVVVRNLLAARLARA